MGWFRLVHDGAGHDDRSMRASFDRLPPVYRDFLTRRIGEHRTLAQTAEALDISESSAQLLQLRALRALQREQASSADHPVAASGLRRLAATLLPRG